MQRRNCPFHASKIAWPNESWAKRTFLAWSPANRTPEIGCFYGYFTWPASGMQRRAMCADLAAGAIVNVTIAAMAAWEADKNKAGEQALQTVYRACRVAECIDHEQNPFQSRFQMAMRRRTASFFDQLLALIRMERMEDDDRFPWKVELDSRY